jgi:hypothetical protein
MLHEALLPGWLVPVALALVGLLLAATLLWFAVLRPAVQTTARNAAREAAQAVLAAPMAKLSDTAAKQGQAIDKLAQGLPTPNPGAAAPPGNPLGAPFDGRLQPGQTVLTVEDKSTVSVTDIIFENPNGDLGQIQLRRVATSGHATVLLDPKLDNFRDLDYHFVSPLTLTAGQKLQLDLSGCKVSQSAPGGAACSSNVYYTGYRAQSP